MPVALSIAGSDPSGGAGIQADLKTFHAFGAYGAAVVSSLTAQNTVGVRERLDVPPAFVTAQLDAVLDDLDVAAAKTGLLPDPDVVAAVAAALRRRPVRWLVVDPVLIATSGDALTADGVHAALRDVLFPLASLVTPNVPEAEALAGCRIRDVADMRAAGRALLASGARAVLVTGGHLEESACDVLVMADATLDFDAPRLPVGPVHGTGCTLSAAITAGLAHGRALPDAVRAAKRYVGRAIAAGQTLGRGSRVLGHHVPPDDPG